MEYVPIAALFVAILGLFRSVWEPRLLGRGQRGRDAAASLMEIVREQQDDLLSSEVISSAPKTAELRVKWAEATRRVRDDLPSDLRDRLAGVDELIAAAERLGLRRDSHWIKVAVLALGDLECAASRIASGRRPGPRTFVSRDDMLATLQQGQALRTGLAPLSHAAWEQLRRADALQRRRDASVLAVSSAVASASAVLLIVQLT